MRVLIPGGAGYIGSILVPMLLDAGHRCTVLDNFLYGQTPFLDLCGHPDLEIIRDDVRHTVALRRALADQDAVIPLAAIVGAPACARDQMAAQSVNLEAIRLLMRCRSTEQLVVFPMTNSGYGNCPPGKRCDEDAPLRPLSLYGRLKVAAEAVVLAAEHTVSLRFATLFGPSPRMRTDLLVNDFTWRAATDGWLVLYEGHYRRSILHVWDAARAFLWALEGVAGGTLRHRVYNVAGDPGLTKRELCHAIHRQVSHFRWFDSDAGRDPDQRDYDVDCGRVLADGWKAERTLEEGIGELLMAYRILGHRSEYANA